MEQKNLGLVADIIDRALAYDAGAKFIVLASAGDDQGGRPLRQPWPNMRLVTPVGSIATERLIKHCRDSFWLGAIFV